MNSVELAAFSCAAARFHAPQMMAAKTRRKAVNLASIAGWPKARSETSAQRAEGAAWKTEFMAESFSGKELGSFPAYLLLNK
jgi:hypothetical protein